MGSVHCQTYLSNPKAVNGVITPGDSIYYLQFLTVSLFETQKSECMYKEWRRLDEPKKQLESDAENSNSHDIPSKRPLPFSGLHDIISQEIELFMLKDVRTTNPTYKLLCTD
jgi:hypothetical protein